MNFDEFKEILDETIKSNLFEMAGYGVNYEVNINVVGHTSTNIVEDYFKVFNNHNTDDASKCARVSLREDEYVREHRGLPHFPMKKEHLEAMIKILVDENKRYSTPERKITNYQAMIIVYNSSRGFSDKQSLVMTEKDVIDNPEMNLIYVYKEMPNYMTLLHKKCPKKNR